MVFLYNKQILCSTKPHQIIIIGAIVIHSYDEENMTSSFLHCWYMHYTVTHKSLVNHYNSLLLYVHLNMYQFTYYLKSKCMLWDLWATLCVCTVLCAKILQNNNSSKLLIYEIFNFDHCLLCIQVYEIHY